jgi:hypothetical protein
MPTKGTYVRSVRVNGALWDRARDKARRNGTDISSLIRAWLEVYSQRD